MTETGGIAYDRGGCRGVVPPLQGFENCGLRLSRACASLLPGLSHCGPSALTRFAASSFPGLRCAPARALTLRAFGPDKICGFAFPGPAALQPGLSHCGPSALTKFAGSSFPGLRCAPARAVTLRALGPDKICGFAFPGLRSALARAVALRAFGPDKTPAASSRRNLGFGFC